MSDKQSPSVVVGIDGSRAAIDAALWAADDAVARDIPLRLIYAIDPERAAGSDNEGAARELAAAKLAVHHALMAVESTGKPVKIEVEIVQDRPVHALRSASARAAMLCVGSMGLVHSTQGRIGSTAAALAKSAHCPVAVVQERKHISGEPGWVVAEIDESPSSDATLLHAIAQAQQRGASLRVLAVWQSRYTDAHDNHAVSTGNRLATRRSDRRLSECRRLQPDLEVRGGVVHGSILDYVAKHAESIQLLVTAHDRAGGITELIGPKGFATLRNAGCSVLVCDGQNVL